VLVDKRYELCNDTVLTYDKERKGAAVFYSGGLESVLISLNMIQNVNFYYVDKLYEFCHANNMYITESFLMAITPLLGNSTMINGLGSRIIPIYTEKNYEYSNEFIELFSKYLDISSILPVNWMNKFSLFQYATMLGIEFNSCNAVDILGKLRVPCGNCFKCFQISTFQRAINLPSPIEVNKELVDQMLIEHNQYLKDGIDLFDDNYSFTCIDKTMEEVWNLNT
jgi:hypothetical protein